MTAFYADNARRILQWWYVRCARGIVLIVVRKTALILKARVLREDVTRDLVKRHPYLEP